MTQYEPVSPVTEDEHEPEAHHGSEPDHVSELGRESEPDYEFESEPGPPQPEYGPERKLSNADQIDQSGPLGLAQPDTLNRTVMSRLLLAATDGIMVLAWTGMFIYAVLVWYARDKFIDEMSFSAAELIAAATT